MTPPSAWGHRAAIRYDGVVRYVGFAEPTAVYVDIGLLRNAPPALNLSGVGVVKGAPNKANAVKFIEFLASDRAQEVFAKGNNEYPIAPSAQTIPVLKQFGDFKEDKVNAAKFGNNNTEAIRMMDRAGWR